MGLPFPHSRLEGVEKALVAVVTLNSSIDYDAIDDQYVDILFALLVPQECTEEHLQILASAAEMFSNDKICNNLRKAQNEQENLPHNQTMATPLHIYINHTLQRHSYRSNLGIK